MLEFGYFEILEKIKVGITRSDLFPRMLLMVCRYLINLYFGDNLSKQLFILV